VLVANYRRLVPSWQTANSGAKSRVALFQLDTVAPTPAANPPLVVVVAASIGSWRRSRKRRHYFRRPANSPRPRDEPDLALDIHRDRRHRLAVTALEQHLPGCKLNGQIGVIAGELIYRRNARNEFAPSPLQSSRFKIGAATNH
jgi:hypothetical protein